MGGVGGDVGRSTIFLKRKSSRVKIMSSRVGRSARCDEVFNLVKMSQ